MTIGNTGQNNWNTSRISNIFDWRDSIFPVKNANFVISYFNKIVAKSHYLILAKIKKHNYMSGVQLDKKMIFVFKRMLRYFEDAACLRNNHTSFATQFFQRIP